MLIRKALAIFTLYDSTGWGVGLQTLLALLLAWWLGLDPLQHTLGGILTLDWIYGSMVAARSGEWRWAKGAWGITQRAMIFSMCLFFGSMIKRHGFGEYGAAGLAIFYICNSAGSIFKTFKRADIAVAPMLFDQFSRLLQVQQQSPPPGVRVSTDAPADITITPAPPRNDGGR